MEKKSQSDAGSPDRRDRKVSLIVAVVTFLLIASAVVVTAAWFALIGYGVLALLGWIAR